MKREQPKPTPTPIFQKNVPGVASISLQDWSSPSSHNLTATPGSPSAQGKHCLVLLEPPGYATTF